MKQIKVGAIKYRSRSAYARILLSRGKMSDSDIAKKVGMTPQTVFAVKQRMKSK
jgi:predicted ArsR family transcriptional regulator